jgi:hypothetical protein
MSLAPYERLLALAEREAALVGAGALGDLPALAAEREATVAGLPATPPRAAGALLSQLAGMQGLATAALAAGRVEAGRELGSLRRGRGAVHGYAASVSQTAAPSARLDGSA